MANELFHRTNTHITLTDFELLLHAYFIDHLNEYIESSKEGFLAIYSHINTIFTNNLLEWALEIENNLPRIMACRSSSNFFGFEESNCEIGMSQYLKCCRNTRYSSSDNDNISFFM
jgi:hypothetical protein